MIRKKNTKILIALFFMILNKNIISNIDLEKMFLNKNMPSFFDKKNGNGSKEIYYPNGKIKEKQYFQNNKKAGLWEIYYETGVLKSTLSFSKFSSKEEALVKNYDEDGFLFSEGKMINGNKVSVWIYYDKDGKKNHSFNHTNGEIIIFDSNGKAILNIETNTLAEGIKKAQKEIKNDKTKSFEEKNR